MVGREADETGNCAPGTGWPPSGTRSATADARRQRSRPEAAELRTEHGTSRTARDRPDGSAGSGGPARGNTLAAPGGSWVPNTEHKPRRRPMLTSGAGFWQCPCAQSPLRDTSPKSSSLRWPEHLLCSKKM